MNLLWLPGRGEGSVAWVLADIAHEFSSTAGWVERVENALAMLGQVLPAAAASLLVRVPEHRLFHANEGDFKEMERMLGRRLSVLMGEDSSEGDDSHPASCPVCQKLIHSGDRDGRSFLSLPVIGDGQILGVLYFCSDSGKLFSADDAGVLAVVASQLGAYLKNVQAYSEQERARLALERAEQAVRTTNTQMAGILESITDAFFALDSLWRFTYVNREAERLLRKRRSELIGQHIWDMFPEAAGSDSEREYARALKEQVPVVFETFYPPFGAWFEVHAYPSNDGLSVYFQDVSNRHQAEEALRKSHQRLELLSESASRLLASDKPDREAHELAFKTMSYLDCDLFFNHLVNEDEQRLVLNAYAGVGQDTVDGIKTLGMGEAVCGRAACASCRPVIENVQQSDDSRARLVKSLGVRAYACQPLLAQSGEVLGTLSFGTRSRDTFTNDELSVMRVVADQFAVALERVKLRDAEQRQREALRQSEGRLRRLVESDIIGVIFSEPSGTIFDANDAFLEIVGYSREDLTSGLVRWIDITPEEYLHLDRQGIAEAQERGACTPYEKEYIRKDGSRVPIIIGYARLEGPDENYICYIVDLSKQKAVEAELALARREAEQRAAQLESFLASMADGVTLLDAQGRILFMNEAGKRILGVGDLKSIAEWASLIQRFDMQGNPFPPEQMATYKALGGETVMDSRYRLITPDGRSIVFGVSAAPVRDHSGRIIGAVNVFRDQSQRVEYEELRERLLERERHISEVLQQALVPRMEYDIACCRVVTRYQPALKEAEVGGDFYDVFELGDGRVGVLIGDVAGKGLAAAIRVAAARYAIRSYAYMGHGPSRVLTLANEALCRDNSEYTGMVTAFFAVVDTRVGAMTFANAGHEMPFVRTAGGTVKMLNIEGRALGVMGGYVYPESGRRLGEGDAIVMFTDGITEARTSPTDLFGYEGVEKFLTQNLQITSDDIADGLFESARTHAGGNLRDDVAIVVFELKEIGA